MRNLTQTYLLHTIPRLLTLSLAGFGVLLAVGVSEPVRADHCGGADEVEVSVPVEDDKDHVCSGESLENNVIVNYLRFFVQFLTAGVGLVTTLMIVVGGIQYITSRENPQAVQAAKQKVFNAIVALVLFILMYAILNYLVPIEIF